MADAELPKEVSEKVLEAMEIAKATGKIKKGTNEVTKAIERGEAKMVVIAKDVNPPEIVMHIPLLCKEKDIVCFKTSTREELGSVAGLDIPTGALAIIQEGESSKLIKELKESSKSSQ